MSRCGCADVDMRSIFGYCAKCGGTTSHRVDVNKVIEPDRVETYDPELRARDHADAALGAIGIPRTPDSPTIRDVYAIVERAWFAGYAARQAKS